MSHRSLLLAAVALLFTACNTDSPTTPLVPSGARADAAGPPTVVSTTPISGAHNVSRTANITATFNEDMMASTINTHTIVLTLAGSVVSGTVSYASRVATLNPTYSLEPNTIYTVTVAASVEDATGTQMGTRKRWSFTTVATSPSGPALVNLGKAGGYVILAKSAVSTTGTTKVYGNIGLSPAAASYITGFSLIMDATNTFSTSSLVSGKVYAANYTPPTPANLTTAVLDMQTAYTDAAGRPFPDFTELGAGNITGKTLHPGLYKWGTGVHFTGGVTLQGDANSVWIFQIAQNLTVANGAAVTLSGGALPKNIFWQVAGQVTLGTTSRMKGVILSKTLIAMKTGSALKGRALAQTAVTLDATAVTKP
jgi:hypothetical protein